MKPHPIIDMHAHILSEEMMRRIGKEAPAVSPKLSEVGALSGTLQIGNIHQKPFPRGGWDLELRLADMDAAQVDMQVLSVLPQTFLYDLEPERSLAVAATQNDAIADIVKAHPDRFLGIANVPLKSPELAARELERAMREKGMRGAMICSHVEGMNLDHPSLEPFWEKAEALGAFILIHPQKVAASDRLGSYYLKNFIGNPLETTIAAGSLIFGGVLERHPRLKFCLSHGGGFAPYQYGRWIHGWGVRDEARTNLPNGPQLSMGRFIYDTILHSAAHAEFLLGQAGTGHMVLGSDYPFDMGSLDCVRFVRSLAITEEDRDEILSGAPARLLGGLGKANG